ncbi:MAG: PQQ-binding-like beta-propeller repeat protein [Acidobacteriota bacterium]|nr:PQQ-binding-like beta-propeller repeat protein [Acidobacteriota bacterium]
MILLRARPVTHPLRNWNLVIASITVATTFHIAGPTNAGQNSTDWPQLLGPRRDGTAVTAIKPWAAGGPNIRWRRTVGEGFAGPSVVGKRLILFHRVRDLEVVEALEVSTGEALWSTSYPTTYRDDFGFDEGPRATPTVINDHVFTYGAEGILQALDFASGKRLWSVDTHTEFGVRKGFFGAACSPLVYDGKVMVNVGGPAGAGIVAFDSNTGAVLWKATDHGASYSAPIIMTIRGQPTALFFTRAGLVALDPKDGTVIAEFPWRSRLGASVNAATPLVIDQRVFISASYGTGAALLDLQGSSFVPIWTSDEILTNHYATSVYANGYLYGYHGRQEYSPALRSVDLETGSVAWTVDQFGGGTVILAGNSLLILRERGELILANATPEAFQPLARAQILSGVVRAFPALANGTLFARSERELVAVELSQH